MAAVPGGLKEFTQVASWRSSRLLWTFCRWDFPLGISTLLLRRSNASVQRQGCEPSGGKLLCSVTMSSKQGPRLDSGLQCVMRLWPPKQEQLKPSLPRSNWPAKLRDDVGARACCTITAHTTAPLAAAASTTAQSTSIRLDKSSEGPHIKESGGHSPRCQLRALAPNWHLPKTRTCRMPKKATTGVAAA